MRATGAVMDVLWYAILARSDAEATPVSTY
jgi:hypothetical protein